MRPLELAGLGQQVTIGQHEPGAVEVESAPGPRPKVTCRAGAAARWVATTGSSALPMATCSGRWSAQSRALAAT